MKQVLDKIKKAIQPEVQYHDDFLGDFDINKHIKLELIANENDQDEEVICPIYGDAINKDNDEDSEEEVELIS